MSIEQKIVSEREFRDVIGIARGAMADGWRVVPGSAQCVVEHFQTRSSERVNVLSHFMLLMERPAPIEETEEVQVVERADFDWYQTTSGSGYTAVGNALLQAMLTSVIAAWPDWRSWPEGAPGREKMERQEEVYKALLRFVMEAGK